MFSCEFCEISKNTFFYRTSLVAASEDRRVLKVAALQVLMKKSYLGLK